MDQQTGSNSFTDTVQEIRTNLQMTADILRKMDMRRAENVAANLDRLRIYLKRYVAIRERNN
jgi:hypothetical protein